MLMISAEAALCLLCAEPACTLACTKKQDPARALRAVRFDNAKTAAAMLDKAACAGCAAPCEAACLHYDRPVRIKEFAAALPQPPAATGPAPSLALDFCGVHCENPFFLSSSCVGANYDMVARAFEMGWAGVAFKTISVEPCNEVSPRFSAIKKDGTPFVGFKNLEQLSDHTLEENLAVMRRLKENYPHKVLIASIMGQTDEEWTRLTKAVCEAGADIIECNFSCPQMAADGMGSDVGQNPELVRHYTAVVAAASTVPVMPKMTPNIQDITVPALAGKNGGAAAISAINTIKCLTGIDENTFVSYPSVAGKCAVSGYSGKAVKPIALKFIADLACCPELKGCELSGIGGIETWKDALEFLLLGCRNVQVTTAIMQYGYRIIDDLTAGLSAYLAAKGCSSLDEIIGKALPQLVTAAELDRDTLVYPMLHREQCIGCGRCVLSCRDGGHQALELKDGKARLLAKKCVGCHLCAMVCPVGAIGTEGKRITKP